MRCMPPLRPQRSRARGERQPLAAPRVRVRRDHETAARRPDRLRHRRARHLGRAAPERRGNRAAGRPADPHHVDRDATPGAGAAGRARHHRRAAHRRSGCRRASPGRRHRRRADRRHRAGAHADPAGHRERQARRHRQQGVARAIRQRDLRGRAREGRDGRVRRRGGGRHADHQGAARRADREPDRVDRRHHQRHVQFHPVDDARDRRVVRNGAEGSAGARLRRGRSDVRHRRHRRRAQAHDHVGDRIRRADAVRQGVHRRHLEADARGHPLRGGAGLPDQAARHHAARAEGHRVARASDADSHQAADRQRRGRDERGAGQGRRGRARRCTTAPAPARSRRRAPSSPISSMSRGCTPPIPSTACRISHSSPTS